MILYNLTKIMVGLALGHVPVVSKNTARSKQMKNRMQLLVLCLTIISLVMLFSGCDLLNPGNSKSPSPASSPGTLTSEWAMTRVSIDPPLPSAVPDLVVDQALPKSPTWKITLSGNRIDVVYDGNKMWFNSMGFDVTVNTPSSTVKTDQKSGTVNGGGRIAGDKLPGVLGIIGMAKGISNISVDYTDKVDITLNANDTINAIITYTAKGSYNDSDGKQSLNSQGKITYTGKRK
jgi:hypothetical protein